MVSRPAEGSHSFDGVTLTAFVIHGQQPDSESSTSAIDVVYSPVRQASIS